eukprot:COSAG01_NODE_13657_length_1552_cov_4.295251_1_plen_66_part_00
MVEEVLLLLLDVLWGLERPVDVQDVRGIAGLMLLGLAVARDEDLLGDTATASKTAIGNWKIGRGT